MIYISLPVLFLAIGAALCAPEHVQTERESSGEHSQASENLPAPEHVAKRSPHYNFGLGKRMYSYVSEYKRLPVYNFGLGKRSRPYSFGLGKRSIDADALTDAGLNNELDQETLSDLLEQYDDTGYEVKRARPYSFGLGKRGDDEMAEEKRARTYDFGLGKRLYDLGLEKRARNYNFGLGKRLSSKFNFGLGKRQRDLHRFNFGLGKRSVDNDDTDEYEA